jgi:hypothetical protein
MESDEMRWSKDKSSSLGMPMSPQEISKRYKHQSLGMPLSHPFFIVKNQVTFQETIFLLLHILCVFPGASLLLLSVLFCFVCCNKWFDHIMFVLERDLLHFSFAKNTLFFTLFVQRVFSFSATMFSFHFSPWFLFRYCYIFASRCIYTTGLCWFSSKELSQKGLNGVGKEKNFHAKSGTKRSLFRLRLRLLHAMLDVILIVCLVIFVVAWLVSNDWDFLMSLWKKLCIVFIIWKHLFGFLLWCFIWVDLAHAYHMLDSNKSPYSLYDHLVFDLWCHLMLLLMMFCRYEWLWPLLLS